MTIFMGTDKSQKEFLKKSGTVPWYNIPLMTMSIFATVIFNDNNEGRQQEPANLC
jgi:hypothetical protein